MSTTIHEAVFDSLADEWSESKVGRDLLRRGRELSKSWGDLDLMGRHHHRTPGQMVALVWLQAVVAAGHIHVFNLATRGEPAADRERRSNSDTLSDLPVPFHAYVELGLSRSPGDDSPRMYPGDGDGLLSWDQAVNADRLTPGGGTIRLEPTTVPLEIGQTTASRTVLHLVQDGAVARWPYDMSCIIVMVMDEEQRWCDVEAVGSDRMHGDPMDLMLRALRGEGGGVR